MARRCPTVAVKQGGSFKGRQFTAEVILWAVRWYLMFPISYRDLELLLQDRGVTVDHTTISLDPGLRRGTRKADPAAAAAEQRLVAGGRDVCEGEGPLGLPVPGGGQPRPDDRLPALSQARCRGGQAVLPQGLRAAAYGEPAHDHGGQERCLPESHGRDEAGWRALAVLSTTAMQVSQ